MKEWYVFIMTCILVVYMQFRIYFHDEIIQKLFNLVGMAINEMNKSRETTLSHYDF